MTLLKGHTSSSSDIQSSRHLNRQSHRGPVVNISMMLFQIDFDRFSAIVVDVDHQKKVWTAKFNSRTTLLQSLDGAGVVTKAELNEIEKESCFTHGAPVFRVSLTLSDLENAGFSASNM